MCYINYQEVDILYCISQYFVEHFVDDFLQKTRNINSYSIL